MVIIVSNNSKLIEDSFARNCQTVFQTSKVHHFKFWQAVNSHTPLLMPTCGGVSVLDFSHSNQCVVIFHCCLNLQLPSHILCGTYFHWLHCHLYIFFGKVSLQGFCPFFNLVVCFLIVDFKGSWYILDPQSFVRYVFYKYFSPSPWFVLLFYWQCFLQSRKFSF